MVVIQSSLLYVVKRFPSHKDLILELFRKNQKFQTICDDYRLCSEALERWNQSTAQEAPARREEYGMLLQGLAEEILLNMNDLK